MADARRLFSWLLSLRTALAVSTDDEAKMMALPVTTIICKGLDGTGRQGQYKVRRVAASLLQGFVFFVWLISRIATKENPVVVKTRKCAVRNLG